MESRLSLLALIDKYLNVPHEIAVYVHWNIQAAGKHYHNTLLFSHQNNACLLQISTLGIIRVEQSLEE